MVLEYRRKFLPKYIEPMEPDLTVYPPPPEFSFRQNETSLKRSEILSIENFQLSRRKNCSHELIAKVGAIIINWCDLKKGGFMQNK